MEKQKRPSAREYELLLKQDLEKITRETKQKIRREKIRKWAAAIAGALWVGLILSCLYKDTETESSIWATAALFIIFAPVGALVWVMEYKAWSGD